MSKIQLSFGISSSMAILCLFLTLSYFIQARFGPISPATYALLGWVSGMVGLFVAGASNE